MTKDTFKYHAVVTQDGRFMWMVQVYSLNCVTPEYYWRIGKPWAQRLARKKIA